MKRALVLAFCLLATGLDFGTARGQDITDTDAFALEGIGTTCIALAIFAEARHESYFGQALLAHVIINQQSALPPGADACDVVQASGQFHSLDAWAYPREPWRIDPIAWARALEVAQITISGDYDIPPPCFGVTSFHALSAPASTDTPSPSCEVGALAFSHPVDALHRVQLSALEGLAP